MTFSVDFAGLMSFANGGAASFDAALMRAKAAKVAEDPMRTTREHVDEPRSRGGSGKASGSGSAGSVGSKGSNGSKGSGSVGSKGSGSKGSVGSGSKASGSKGSGSVGSKGSNGSKGSGSVGSKASGSKGSVGSKGSGSAGSKGSGSVGSKGSGSKGSVGSGSKASKASGSKASGSNGSKGSGSNGSKGSGSAGSRGSKGSGSHGIRFDDHLSEDCELSGGHPGGGTGNDGDRVDIKLDEHTRGVKEIKLDYHRGQDRVKLEIEIEAHALLPSGARDIDAIDISEIEGALFGAGASSVHVDKLEFDGELKLEIHAFGLSSSDFRSLGDDFRLTYELDDGRIICAELCATERKAHSPSAIDMNGDGRIGVTGATSSIDKDEGAALGRTVSFDIDGDGDRDTIEWFAGGDGILVDNRDGMAADDMSGARLFGDEGGRYANGYEKLAELDANGDGAISGDELDGLALWMDDGDAVVERGEMVSASDAGVASISTAMTEEVEDGRAHMRSTATMADGSTRMSEDVWFAGGEASGPKAPPADPLAAFLVSNLTAALDD